jgi:hypothetical protein
LHSLALGLGLKVGNEQSNFPKSARQVACLDLGLEEFGELTETVGQ